MKFFYLNLDSRPDRNQKFINRNSAHSSFDRLSAIDGKQVERQNLIAKGVVSPNLTSYTDGAIGCALSHAMIWDYSVKNNIEVTVAEDDAVINYHFMEKSARIKKSLPPDWDVILWGWNLDSVLYVKIFEGIKSGVILFDKEDIGPYIGVFQQRCFDVMALRLLVAFGTVCYSVSASGARLLKRLCFPIRSENIYVPILGSIPNYGIDICMSKVYRQLKAYAVFPPLVVPENNRVGSDIQ